MRAQLKALSQETLIYGASTVMGRFLNFLLVPFYVNVLRTTAEYGISTSLYTYITFAGVIFTLGLEASYFRYASRGETEQRTKEEEKRLFSTPFLFVLIFGIFLTIVILLLAPLLVWPAFHDPKSDITPLVPMLVRILRYGTIIVLLDSLNVIPFAALRMDRRAKWFATIRLINIVLTLILNFLFILKFHMGVEGIFIANLVASATMMLMLLPTVIRRFEWKITRSVMKTMLPFGLTNVPAYLSSMMVQVIDRPIVQNILGLGILGIYQANYRMGFTMMVFVSLFEYAWRPFFLREAKTDDARARVLFSRVFTYFMLIATLGFLILSFALPYIVSTPIFGRTLLRKDYLTGLNIIPVVLFAYVFQGMYTNFIAGIYIKERNKVLPFVTGLGAAVNVGTNFLLIPILGIMGAALATLFAYMAMAGALYTQSQKVYPIPYDWRRVGTLFAISLGGYGIERLIYLDRWIVAPSELLLLRVAIVITATMLLFVTGFFSKGEIAFLKQQVNRVKGNRAITIPSEQADLQKTLSEPVEKAKERQEGS